MSTLALALARALIRLALLRRAHAGAQAGLAILRYIGGQPGSFELAFLKLLNAPQWEESLANNITMARARIGFWGILGFYAMYLLGGYIPYFHWMICPAFGSLLIAALLDAVDGDIARKYAETAFGRFIDPFADKAIAWSTFVVLLHHYGLRQWLVIPIVGIVAYDIAVSLERGRDAQMRTSKVAKVKQVALDVAIGMLLLGVFFQWHVAYRYDLNAALMRQFCIEYGPWMLWFAFELTIISALIYYKNRLNRLLWAYCSLTPDLPYLTAPFV